MNQKPEDIVAVKDEIKREELTRMATSPVYGDYGIFRQLCRYALALLDSNDRLRADVAALQLAAKQVSDDHHWNAETGRKKDCFCDLCKLLANPNPGQALLDELERMKREHADRFDDVKVALRQQKRAEDERDTLAAENARLTDSRDSFREQFAAKKFECDDLEAENARLRERLEAAERIVKTTALATCTDDLYAQVSDAHGYLAKYAAPEKAGDKEQEKT